MDCALCHEPITNPVCQDCLGEGVAEWLGEHRPHRVHDLHVQTSSLRADTVAGIDCIRCKREFAVCPYCYGKEVFNWLKDGELQLSYLRFFNFFT